MSIDDALSKGEHTKSKDVHNLVKMTVTKTVWFLVGPDYVLAAFRPSQLRF